MDGGLGGNYGILEFGIAELADGRILMLGFSGVGRIFRSYSRDAGETWNEAEPTQLQGSGPMSVKRIPGTNDVLAIWCQSSRWEAINGFSRHRLSCAVTSDGGLTFDHFNNLESLDDVNRIEPEPLTPYYLNRVAKQPLDSVRYHRAPGPLRVDHPFCTFQNGNAIIGYGIGNPGDLELITRYYHQDIEQFCRTFGFERDKNNPNRVAGSNKVQVIPVDWFYSR